jgi:hypothetical protein
LPDDVRAAETQYRARWTRLRHIADALSAAIRFTEGRGREDLDKDEMLALALVHAILIGGEAAGKVTAELRDQHLRGRAARRERRQGGNAQNVSHSPQGESDDGRCVWVACGLPVRSTCHLVRGGPDMSEHIKAHLRGDP